jgi:hypothetical protein
MGQKKTLQACKPDSVPFDKLRALSFICSRYYYRDVSAYPPTLNEQFSSVGLCGISACKVCPQMMLSSWAVSSYLTFSPLPVEALAKAGFTAARRRKLFSVALSVVRRLTSATRLLAGALLCAVRTFLPAQGPVDSLACSENFVKS